MTKVTLLTSLLFILASCAPYDELQISGEQDYKDLLDQFVADGKRYGDYDIDLGANANKTTISISAVPLGLTRLASCRRISQPGMSDVGVIFTDEIQIWVNKDLWPTADQGLKEAAFYHELGHCFLDLDHDNSFIVVDGESLPGSIMSSYAFKSGPKYLLHRDYYLRKLFNFGRF